MDFFYTILTLFIIIAVLPEKTAHAVVTPTAGHVVQFLVYAQEQADVTRLFPGAYVDFTWNNVFIVSIWTNDPDGLMQTITSTLSANENVVQLLVPPYTMNAATQKWLEYNMLWVVLIVLVFLTGCVCGGMMIAKCADVRRHMHYTRCNAQSRNG